MYHIYFISSPLHLFLASNLVQVDRAAKHIAVIVSKSHVNGQQYAAALAGVPLFDEVVIFSKEAKQSRRSYLALYREFVVKLVDRLENEGQHGLKVYAGNDRRIEFQLMMHYANRASLAPVGCYIDDGIATYIGHKSLNRWDQKYLDPIFRKLRYGLWYRHGPTVGASSWVQKLYVAFPEYVHPLLKSKSKETYDAELFTTDVVKQLASGLMADSKLTVTSLKLLKFVITLPHESALEKYLDSYLSILKILCKTQPASLIGIKLHPRQSHPGKILKKFEGAVHLDSSIGFEIILPLLDEGTCVIGDVSTTLLSARWLRPTMPVIALDFSSTPPELIDLYVNLDIASVSCDDFQSRLEQLEK